MSTTDLSCIYNKEHSVPVYEKGRLTEERKLTVSVFDLKERDILVVKVKDPDDFSFNFSENIDPGDFEVMRNNQNLDINFTEFKSNLIEMLQQHLKQEMYLKVDYTDGRCTLIFYGKSKIKFVVYLTVELKMANHKEIFTEMTCNLKQLQDVNDRLKWQVSTMKKNISEKDREISEIKSQQSRIVTDFFNQATHIESVFNRKASQITQNLTAKLEALPVKIGSLSQQLKKVKMQNELHATSSQRLLKTMEDLRYQTDDNANLIDSLKRENSGLLMAKNAQEKIISDLNSKMQEMTKTNNSLQAKNEELRSDLEKLSIIIAQKKETNDELARDVVQANQMLVNFNNHYDKKVKQIEELNNALAAKEQFIKEQRLRSGEIIKEFEDYKSKYNPEEFEKLKHELALQRNKIQELEGSIRKVNKMNTILTQKVSDSMGFGS